MRVIIAGPRDFVDEEFIFKNLDRISKSLNITEVVHGKAKGVDTIAGKWVKYNKIKVTEFPADWDTFGKKAGFLRNKQMAEYADYLIAFYGGSKGTGMMIEIMKNSSKPYQIISIKKAKRLVEEVFNEKL